MAAIALVIRAALSKIVGKAVVQSSKSHIAVKLGKKTLFTSQSPAVAKQFADGFNRGMKGEKLAGHDLLSTKMGYHKSNEVTSQLKGKVEKRVRSELKKDLFGGSDNLRRSGVRVVSQRGYRSSRNTVRGNRYNASNTRGARHSSQSTKAPKFSNFKGSSVKYGKGPNFSNTKYSNIKISNTNKYSNVKHSNFNFGRAPRYSSSKYSSANFSNSRRSR